MIKPRGYNSRMLVWAQPVAIVANNRHLVREHTDERSKEFSINWKEEYAIQIKDKELYIDVLKWKLKIEKYREIKNYLDWFKHGITHIPYNILIDEYNYHKQKSDFCKKFNINF